jgi:hypothetical protein
MGSGFPLFYNFIIWCIGILVTVFVISGGYNMYTNYMGNDCSAPELDFNNITPGTFTKEMAENQTKICHSTLFNRLSIANKISDNDSIAT